MIVIDVLNPVKPVQYAHYTSTNHAYNLVVNPDYAFIAAYPDGLQVIDITNPNQPVWAAVYQTSSYCMSVSVVAVDDQYAYIADGDSGICILNLLQIRENLP